MLHHQPLSIPGFTVPSSSPTLATSDLELPLTTALLNLITFSRVHTILFILDEAQVEYKSELVSTCTACAAGVRLIAFWAKRVVQLRSPMLRSRFRRRQTDHAMTTEEIELAKVCSHPLPYPQSALLYTALNPRVLCRDPVPKERTPPELHTPISASDHGHVCRGTVRLLLALVLQVRIRVSVALSWRVVGGGGGRGGGQAA